MPREKPAKASLDWKPNAHKCRDRESNPELIGAKRGKIRCANLLPQPVILLMLTFIHCSKRLTPIQTKKTDFNTILI